MADSLSNPIFSYRFTVTEDDLDQNGHVNNVRFVQWMQDAAVRHYRSMGGIAPAEAIGATWVVRSHQITYLHPAFSGDEIEVRTWVVNLRRVRSLRKYEFVRISDGMTLVIGETDWVFMDILTGFPKAVPLEVSKVFNLKTDVKLTNQ
jgi:acyl-CoA thioester hydrolase